MVQHFCGTPEAMGPIPSTTTQGKKETLTGLLEPAGLGSDSASSRLALFIATAEAASAARWQPQSYSTLTSRDPSAYATSSCTRPSARLLGSGNRQWEASGLELRGPSGVQPSLGRAHQGLCSEAEAGAGQRGRLVTGNKPHLRGLRRPPQDRALPRHRQVGRLTHFPVDSSLGPFELSPGCTQSHGNWANARPGAEQDESRCTVTRARPQARRASQTPQ